MKIIFILFWKFPTYIIIITNSSCTKVEKPSPITLEGEFITASSLLSIFQWQLTIFHFPPSVGFAFLLNPAEGLTSIETNLKSGFFVNWIILCFLQQQWMVHPVLIKQFLVCIDVPFKLLLHILITLKTFKILRSLIKWRSKCLFSSKKKKFLELFFEVDIFGVSEILFQWSFGLARLMIFSLFISLSVSWIDSTGLFGSVEKLILFYSNEWIPLGGHSFPRGTHCSSSLTKQLFGQSFV